MRLTAIVLSLLLVAACTRGKKKEAGEEQGKTSVQEPAAAQPPEGKPGEGEPASDSAWDTGKLPASVLEGVPKDGGEVVIQVNSEPPSLNRLVDSASVGVHISEHRIWEALVALDHHAAPAHPVVPELAERWEVSDDRRVYTFHLRKGVTWHDGKPFTARDVVATFDKMMDPASKAAHVRAYFDLLSGYKAVGTHAVRFTYKKPYFLTLESFEGVPIQPAHLIEELSAAEYNEAGSNPLNRAPVGTGPFRFVAWEANQKIVLERHEGYWGKKPHVKRVVFRIVKDPTVRRQMALRGDVDVWSRMLDSDWLDMGDEPAIRENYHRSMIYGNQYTWIGWNQKRPFFTDKRVRRALAQLVDRDGIRKSIFRGLPKLTECHFYWASDICKGTEQLPYDRKGALALLDEAGWKDSDGDGVRDRDGVPFRFTFMVPASSVNSAKIVTKLKEDYHRAGIELDIQNVEWGVYSKRLREHEFDACILIWVNGSPRGDPVQVWHSKSQDGGSNYVGFDVPAADTLIEQAAVEFDPKQRVTLYRKFDRILYEEQPYMMLYVSPTLSAVHKRVKGVRDSILWWRIRDWWVEGAR